MVHFMKDGRAICGAAVTSGVSRSTHRVTCSECKERMPDAGRMSADGDPEGAGDPRPTCEGYAPVAEWGGGIAGPLRTGDKVRLTAAVRHHVRQKDIAPLTNGAVLAVRRLGGDDGPQALVKFEGFAWPKAVPVSLLERVEP